MTTSPESLSEIYNYRAIGEQLGRTALLHQPRREPIAPRLSSQRRQPYDLARRRRQQPGVLALRHRRLPRSDGGRLGERLVYRFQSRSKRFRARLKGFLHQVPRRFAAASPSRCEIALSSVKPPPKRRERARG